MNIRDRVSRWAEGRPTVRLHDDSPVAATIMPSSYHAMRMPAVLRQVDPSAQNAARITAQMIATYNRIKGA